LTRLFITILWFLAVKEFDFLVRTDECRPSNIRWIVEIESVDKKGCLKTELVFVHVGGIVVKLMAQKRTFLAVKFCISGMADIKRL